MSKSAPNSNKEAAENKEPKREARLEWYLLRAVSGQERSIKQYLEKEVAINHLEEYIPQIVTPTEKTYQIRKLKDGKVKKIIVEKNTLPGYVLVQANLGLPNAGELIHLITNVPGIINFLRVDGEAITDMPKPMREAEVRKILGRIEAAQEAANTEDMHFVVGESVKVMDGPFASMNGVVEKVYEDKKKLKVSFKIFGSRQQPIELGYMQVEKVTFSDTQESAE
jgi:transcription termination/antitermination protein NusG